MVSCDQLNCSHKIYNTLIHEFFFDGHVTVDCLLSIPFLLYVMCLSTSSPVPSLLYPVSDKSIFQCIPSTPTHPDSMYKSFNPEKCRYVNSNSPYLFFQNQRWIPSFFTCHTNLSMIISGCSISALI